MTAANAPAPNENGWVAFRTALEKSVGVPLSQYKEAQMKRRLASLMTRHAIADWQAFAIAIRTNAALLSTVQDTLTINVSEFYRQADRFEELTTKTLPALIAQRKTLRIWSAGCSIGCEPYTLSMILNEIDPAGAHKIIATDVDMPILARAREGAGYLPAEVRAVPPHMLKRYFTADRDTYRVSDKLKRRVEFRRHDLLKDPYPKEIDLILCRNVVIYFTEDAKRHIYAGFASSLLAGGILFVGGSEMLMRSNELGLRANGASMYQKAA